MNDGVPVRVGVTGHRPGSTIDPQRGRKSVARALDELAKLAPQVVLVTGGAIGFDHWVAQECIARDVPFELVLPCSPALFCARWQSADRQVLSDLCQRASRVQILRDQLRAADVTPAIYHARNSVIVQTSHWLVAFWDGRESGGTWQTIRRAWGQRKPVFNAFSGFERLFARQQRGYEAQSASLFETASPYPSV